MDKETQIKYNTFVNIYKHYSGLMFKARISIITVIFLAYGYILGIIQGELRIIPEEVVKILTPVCAGALMSAIFLLEVSYYNNFFKAIRALRTFEKEEDQKETRFFSNYERRNWHFCLLYFIASILFTVLSFYNIGFYREKLSELQRWLAVVSSFFPLLSLLWVWTLLNHNYYLIIKGKDIRGVDLILISMLFSLKTIEKWKEEKQKRNILKSKIAG